MDSPNTTTIEISLVEIKYNKSACNDFPTSPVRFIVFLPLGSTVFDSCHSSNKTSEVLSRLSNTAPAGTLLIEL